MSKVRLAERSLSPQNARTRALRVFSAGVLHGSQVLKGRVTLDGTYLMDSTRAQPKLCANLSANANLMFGICG